MLNVRQFSVHGLRLVSTQASVILLKVSPEELSCCWVFVLFGIKIGTPIIVIIRCLKFSNPMTRANATPPSKIIHQVTITIHQLQPTCWSDLSG